MTNKKPDHAADLLSALLRDSYMSVLRTEQFATVKKTRTAFHGTHCPPAVIEAEGIKPRGSAGADAWAKSIGLDVEPRELVFCSTDRSYAACFAYLSTLANKADRPYVYTVRFPDDAIAKLVPDDRAAEAIAYPGVIAPAWIADASPLTAAELKHAKAYVSRAWVGA